MKKAVKKTKVKREKVVPKEKIELIKKIVDLTEKNNTIMFASIKGLPSKQFQKIKKSLSELNEPVYVIVPKKRSLKRALESSKKNNIKLLNDHLKEDIAVLVSQIDAFELSGILAESKTPVKAKNGQISDQEIEVEPGPTELTAGPVVSELGSLGIKIEIKAGKIEIKEPKIIVKKGQAISENAVSIMGKLNIMPFSVGFIPLVAYDSKSDKIFTELIIDKSGTLETLKEMFAKSMAFAVSMAYPTKETIKFILAKAASHEGALAKLITIENTNTEEKKEDNTPQPEETKSEVVEEIGQ